MASGMDLELIADESDPAAPPIFRLRVEDPELAGHAGEFSLTAEVTVERSGGIDQRVCFHREDFMVRAGETDFRIPREQLRFFSYDGKHIGMWLQASVKVDDAIFFDSRISEDLLIELGAKPKLNTDADEIIDPGDVFRFFANLKAIPAANRMITLALVALGGLAILVGLLVGFHDQFSPESETWLIPPRNSEGETNHPLVAALVGSGALGAGIWFLIRRQLRKYMTFRLGRLPKRIERGREYKVEELFAGTSRVALEDVTLRIVACNLECGQYRERRGTETVTVSFEEPVRGVVLFEKQVSRIPARMPIEQYFNDRMSFDPMFRALYPPAMVTGSHGLDLRWEIQLLHPDFVDQELAGPTHGMAYKDFLEA